MPVSLVVEHGPHRGLARVDLLRRARAMLKSVQLTGAELSILLTDDDRVRELNRAYRQMDKPTDVLAFAQREGELGDQAGRMLGDVVVSVPTARRQAAARAHSLVSEVTMLIAHGLLHLIGWDHDTDAKDRRMRRETERLCNDADAASALAGASRPRPTQSSPRARRRK